MTTYLDALARIHARTTSVGMCRNMLPDYDGEDFCCLRYAGHDLDDAGPEEHGDETLRWIWRHGRPVVWPVDESVS